MPEHPDAVGGFAPPSWKTALNAIPEPFRSYFEAQASRAAGDVARRITDFAAPAQAEAAAEATGLAQILYGAYLPYHLVSAEEQAGAIKLLNIRGPGALLRRMNEKYAAAGTLLVIGDNPSAAEVDEALVCELAAHPPRTVIAGPGGQIAPAVRRLQSRGYTPFHLRADDAGGRWNAPGDALEEQVNNLFAEQRPSSVLVIYPVRTRATQIAHDSARALRLPCYYHTAPPAQGAAQAADNER